ncbi:life-span regulatory factor-domain-containing protein [Aspergillus cavernicola]|uniref:Life-span regulatory factor-domain-containing protein n=1 Tax=Aspergillus cavernicola TaxID=176166 RepID=A0ABR4HWM8_9EURO
MTQSNTFSHHRRSPSGSNSSKLRTGRPVLHRKGASFANSSISKLGSGQARISTADDEPVTEMAASFLNYCAMCERQITVPDNRLLYCSESCRRKDSHKPLSASLPSYITMSAPTTLQSSLPMSPPTIVAPLTPTKAPVTASQPIRIPSHMHDAKTDLDPTEWKPVIATDARSASVMASDAWKYLSQFHGDDSVLPIRRARIDHHSSTSLSTLPSLSHTPSTASSVSSIASDYMGPHESVYRPLLPRHKPSFSGSNILAKGMDLVVPHIAVTPDSPVDVSNSGSIFPASSGLWDEKTVEASTAIVDMCSAHAVPVSEVN